jgi:glycosyltransferase involved in cell wall biosynthesis
VIRIFAEHVAPFEPDATLTVLGAGPDTELYKRVAREHGVGESVFFPGEVPFTKMADFYAYSDVFVHASLSETYGNVMGEAKAPGSVPPRTWQARGPMLPDAERMGYVEGGGALHARCGPTAIGRECNAFA